MGDTPPVSPLRRVVFPVVLHAAHVVAQPPVPDYETKVSPAQTGASVSINVSAGLRSVGVSAGLRYVSSPPLPSV